ncbi:uncharacterized protein [Penaeus vannamei]|uniref:uncharacterized protein n=1 Tax=Penaeus vannamei TaxID=6689 RepID=UPI00387F4A34
MCIRHRRWRWCWPSRCWCRPLGPVASGEEEEAVEAEVEATTAADTTEATMGEEAMEATMGEEAAEGTMVEVAMEETTVETTTVEPVEGLEEEVVEVTTEVEDSEAAGDLEADPEEEEAAGDLEADPEEDSEAAGDSEAALVVKPRSQTTLRRNFCNIRQM